MHISYEKTINDCLTEMFRRVGEEYPNPELTDQDDWYHQQSWTREEEDDFRDWMMKLVKKRYQWPKKKIDYDTRSELVMLCVMQA